MSARLWCILVPWVLLLNGCATGSSPRGSAPAQAAGAEPPASRAAGQQELASLEQEIERDRSALRLGPRLASSPAEVDARPAEAPAPTATSPERALADRGPAPDAAEPAEAAPAKEDRSERESSVDACAALPCRYTRAICTAADRICVLARYLDDQDSRDRCGRARQDCRQARLSTGQKCPGC